MASARVRQSENRGVRYRKDDGRTHVSTVIIQIPPDPCSRVDSLLIVLWSYYKTHERLPQPSPRKGLPMKSLVSPKLKPGMVDEALQVERTKTGTLRAPGTPGPLAS